jgi:hypothetical protein
VLFAISRFAVERGDCILFTWNRGKHKYRLDYIWISNNLIPEIVYSSTNKSHIFSTDHKAMKQL